LNALRNMKFSGKLMALVSVSVIFLLVVGFIGYFFIVKMERSAERMYHDRLLPVKWASEASLNFRLVERNTKEMMLTEDQQNLVELKEEIRQLIQVNDALLVQVSSANIDANQMSMLDRIDESTKKYRPERAKAEDLAESGQQSEAYRYFQEHAKQHLDEVLNQYDLLNEYNAKVSDELLDQLKETELTVTIAIIGITLLSILLAVWFGIAISRMMTRPVYEMLKLMSAAEKGDLTVHSEQRSRDEIGQLAQSFNQMVSGIRNVIAQVGDSASNLAASSQQISAGTEQIAGGSQMQADSAGNAVEMMEEMAGAIRTVARSAEEAAHSAEEASSQARRGSEVIHQTVQGMKEISVKMDQLSIQSQKIGDIVEVIDEIAEQTNLLALNAAIEAARAGEAGKGFAVVADEVRKLAERSGKATKEIAALIGSMQENTVLAVQAASSGNEKVGNAGMAFQEIVAAVQTSSGKVVEIAAASEQQNAQVDEVRQAVSQIAAVTQETSASTQETASTAQELARMAELLNELTSGFKVR